MTDNCDQLEHSCSHCQYKCIQWDSATTVIATILEKTMHKSAGRLVYMMLNILTLIKSFNDSCALNGCVCVCYVSAPIYSDFFLEFVCVCVIYWKNPKSHRGNHEGRWECARVLIGLESICEVVQDIGTFNIMHFKLIPEILSFNFVFSAKALHTVHISHVEMYCAVDGALL